jgi:hypothetical protein
LIFLYLFGNILLEILHPAAIAGVVAYNNHKLKVKPQANPQQGDENKVSPGNPRDVEISMNSTKEAS